MRSLFFWRKTRPATTPQQAEKPAPQAIAAEATAPVAAAPAAFPATPPAIRSVHALALNDERAADMHARPSASQMNLLLAASSEFAQIGTQPRYTPRRPSLLPQLMEAVSDEEVSLRALSRIVAQDPQLTGELLRTSNSALYRVSATPVESVERAATVLGTTGIRTLISAVLVRPLATTGVGGLGRFGDIAWEHSQFSASAGEAWAARSQDADPFAAHLLGLMHGLGTVAVYRVMTDLYAAQPGLTPDAAVIAQALDTNAAVTAGRIATNWGLSDRTRQALEAQSSASPTGVPTPLSRALQFGLLTGALTLLCKHGKLADDAGLERIEAAGFPRTQSTRIWERMLRAYVHP